MSEHITEKSLKKSWNRYISDRGIKECRGIPWGSAGMVSKSICVIENYAAQKLRGRR